VSLPETKSRTFKWFHSWLPSWPSFAETFAAFFSLAVDKFAHRLLLYRRARIVRVQHGISQDLPLKGSGAGADEQSLFRIETAITREDPRIDRYQKDGRSAAAAINEPRLWIIPIRCRIVPFERLYHLRALLSHKNGPAAVTTSIISSFISSSLRRDRLFHGISPYGVTTLTSE